MMPDELITRTLKFRGLSDEEEGEDSKPGDSGLDGDLEDAGKFEEGTEEAGLE